MKEIHDAHFTFISPTFFDHCYWSDQFRPVCQHPFKLPTMFSTTALKQAATLFKQLAG